MHLQRLGLMSPLLCLFMTAATASGTDPSTDFPGILKARASSYSSTTTITTFTTRTILSVPLPTSPPIPHIPSNRTITITNNCTDTIWPGIKSSNGTVPWTHGFELPGKYSQQIWVGWDWVGRIWGRTNCTFERREKPSNGDKAIEYEYVGSCKTGDCGGRLDCAGATNQPPTTLAEFTVMGYQELSFYDISLVDGYNLDVEIIPESKPAGVNPDDLAPKCVATQKKSSRWCPWDLQQSPPDKGPYNRFFWQPDDHIQRPFFDPCLSACAAWGKQSDCCTGEFNDPKKCKPSLYSKKAKATCGDAYSYAYDDKSSTFSVPTGQGFEVIFCPGGQSTNIMERISGTGNQKTSAAAGSSLGTTSIWTIAAAAFVVWMAVII